MPTSEVHPARSGVPAVTASKSTKASAKKPAAAKAKTSNHGLFIEQAERFTALSSGRIKRRQD